MKLVEKITAVEIARHVEKDFNFFDDLFKKLSAYVSGNKKLLIAVSGGPDSMFLGILIYKYFLENNVDLDNLFFVHCNHKTRSETDDEQRFVEEFFGGLNLYVSIYSGNSKKENDLRNWRYGEFQKIIDKENIDILMTGHNLTDRIESSFMNMFRGSGVNGFLSMRFLDENHLLEGVKIIRPLLDFTKKEIEGYCKNYKIPFVIDKTNLDKETSLRNDIRLSLFPQFADYSNKKSDTNNTFFDSMRQIYGELESQEAQDIDTLVQIKKSGYWNSDFAFLWDLPLGFITEDKLLRLLKKLNISTGVEQQTLKDFVSFFHNSKQGYKYINGIYFFLSHEKIYIVKAKEKFWEKHIEKSVIIDKLGEMEMGKELVDIQNEDLVGLEIRYPKEGDRFGSKSWSKYCINQKIPMFWRNFVPVIVEGGKIVKHFYG